MNPTIEQLLEQTADAIGVYYCKPPYCRRLDAEYLVPILRTLLSACHAGPLKGVGETVEVYNALIPGACSGLRASNWQADNGRARELELVRQRGITALALLQSLQQPK